MQRLEKLRKHMRSENIAGMLITSSSNLRYMTNFTGTSGLAIVTDNHAVFITDFRYTEQAKKQAKQFEVIEYQGNVIDEVAKQVERLKIDRLGFEQEHMTFYTYELYKNKLSCELVPTSNMIEKLRIIKDESEIKLIKKAAAIADQAFEHILSYIKPGVRERDIANELEFFMRKLGATSSSFDIIVASGVRSALPHGVASDKIIEHGEIVTLDFGAVYEGYCSDLTRTVAVGDPGEKLKEIYSIVLEAQTLGVEKIKPGMSGKEADAITRNYIAKHGYGEYFGHSTGHGIGLDIHEGPTLSMRSTQLLEKGMVVTVEPGIYITGIGGVRIEDDILLTNDGNERLTHSRKDFIIL